MAQDQLSAELEELLDRYRRRLADLRLDKPAVETPTASEGQPEAPRPEAAPRREYVGGFRRSLRSFKPKARWATVAAVGIAAVMRYFHPLSPGPVHVSYPLPYTDGAGLAYANGRLYSVDRPRQLLFGFGLSDGQVKSAEVFANPAPDALAWGDGFFWSADAGAGAIYQHNNDAGHTVRRAYVSPDRNPTSVYWDGSHLWAADFRTSALSEFAVDDVLAPVKQYTAEGVGFAGMQIEGELLWVCERYRRKMRRFHLGESLSELDDADLEPWLPPSAVVTGCAVTPGTLWIAAINPAELHRFDVKQLAWRAPAGARRPAP